MSSTTILRSQVSIYLSPNSQLPLVPSALRLPAIVTNQPQFTLPIRKKGSDDPTVAAIEKCQQTILDAVGQVRARAQENAKTKVGPRGPVPASKGLTRAEKKKARKNEKRRQKRKEEREEEDEPTGAMRKRVPYRKFFNDLRPNAGFLYDNLPDIPKKHADAIRNRVGKLSKDSVTNISVFDAHLREAFNAATEIARCGRLSAEALIYRLIDTVPWLDGLDTDTVGYCLDYFWQAREAYQENAQAVSRLALMTAHWLLCVGLEGLGGVDLRPFELPKDFALTREWVDPESEESGSEDSESEYEAFRQRLLAEEEAWEREEEEEDWEEEC